MAERAWEDSGLGMKRASSDKTWEEGSPEPAGGKRPPYSQHLHHHGYCLLSTYYLWATCRIHLSLFKPLKAYVVVPILQISKLGLT